MPCKKHLVVQELSNRGFSICGSNMIHSTLSTVKSCPCSSDFFEKSIGDAKRDTSKVVLECSVFVHSLPSI